MIAQLIGWLPSHIGGVYWFAIKDLFAVRDPFEEQILAKQAGIEQEALRLYRDNPSQARVYLTEYVQTPMEDAVEQYRALRYTLIHKDRN